MAIWHADNFTGWGDISSSSQRKACVDAMLQGIYTASSRGSTNDYLYVSSDPQDSSQRILVIGGLTNQHPYIRKTHPAGTQTQLTARFRFYIPSLTLNSNAHVCAFLDGSSSTLINMYFDTTGKAVVAVTGHSTYTTTIPVITAGGWYNIELLVDQTNFTLQIEANTVLGPQAHGLTSPAWNQWLTGSDNNGSGGTTDDFYIKDLVLGDPNGSYNTSFIGTKLIYAATIPSDFSLNWTPSTGSTGFPLLNKVGPDDSTYIYAPSTIPSPYKGLLSDLPANATSVAGIVTRVRAVKSDGGDGNLQVSMISDPAGTPATANGNNRAITTTFTYWQDVFEQDPKTSAAWTVPGYNNSAIQLNRTV